MSIALDYTHEIGVDALQAADVSQVFRYLSYPSASAKVIQIPEYRRLTAAHIDVILNWEFDQYDWLRGEAGARSDALYAIHLAQNLGYSKGWPIIGSCDFDMTANQWNPSQCAGYARTFSQTIRQGGYLSGVYGPWDVLVKCEAIFDVFWQAGMSWAYSNGRNAKRWPQTHWRQMAHRMVGGVDTDWNEIVRSWKMLTQDDIINVASAVVQWATTGGALPSNFEGAHVNLHTMNAKLDQIMLGQANINIDVPALAQDIAAHLVHDPNNSLTVANIPDIAAAVQMKFSAALAQ